ncbi:MAG: hypothetical protein ACYC3I_07155 [Gemmataceae bacterium]
MRRQLTTPILVLAILHLVGGGLGFLGSICTCGGLFVVNSLSSFTPPTMAARPGQPPPPPMPPGPDEVMKYMNEHVPGYRAFTIGALAVDFLMDLMLLAAGIGLLKMQPWARWLSLVYAPISILVHVSSFVYQIIWAMPATNALYSKVAMPGGLSSIMTVSTGIGVFLNLLIIIYPIAVLIILLLPSTAAAFRGAIPVREDDLRDEEGNDDDSWREPSPRSDKFRQ